MCSTKEPKVRRFPGAITNAGSRGTRAVSTRALRMKQVRHKGTAECGTGSGGPRVGGLTPPFVPPIGSGAGGAVLPTLVMHSLLGVGPIPSFRSGYDQTTHASALEARARGLSSRPRGAQPARTSHDRRPDGRTGVRRRGQYRPGSRRGGDVDGSPAGPRRGGGAGEQEPDRGGGQLLGPVPELAGSARGQ